MYILIKKIQNTKFIKTHEKSLFSVPLCKHVQI